MVTESLQIPQEDARKLLGAASPDAALLYIFLHTGNDPRTAGTELKMSDTRLSCAGAMLRQLGLWPEEKKILIAPGERPAYSEHDVLGAMEQDESFRSLYGEVQRQLEDFAMAGGEIAAIDAIELFVGDQARRCQTTLAVLAKPEIRAERIMRRDGISREYALLRIQAQRPDSYFEGLCDHILRNDGSPAEFENECKKLFKEILNHG